MWVAPILQIQKAKNPHHLLMVELGTMGFGFPAAMGAKFAKPNELVISVSGDGSFK